MYVLIWKYVDVNINFLKPICDFEKYIHLVRKIWYQTRMGSDVVHMIWKIRHVDRDERRRTNVNGSMYVDESWWTEGVERMELDGRASMDIEWKLTDVGWNCDGQGQMATLMELRQKTIDDGQQWTTTDGDGQWQTTMDDDKQWWTVTNNDGWQWTIMDDDDEH